MGALKTNNLSAFTAAACSVTAFNFDASLDQKIQGFNKPEYDDSDFYFYGKPNNFHQSYKKYANEKMNHQPGILFFDEFSLKPNNLEDFFELLSSFA